MNKKEYLIQLGKNVIYQRERKKISQAELARLCEKDRQSIERIENGKVNPSIYFLQEIANGLEIDIKDLLTFVKK